MSTIRRTAVTNLRTRFRQLMAARDSGSCMALERVWAIWRVDRATWSHEYWLLRLELQMAIRERRNHEEQQA